MYITGALVAFHHEVYTPYVLATGAIFSRMRAWGRGALPINKMADWLSQINQLYYRQICVARGSVSWGGKDNWAAGELQLWYREMDNYYCLYARPTAGDDMAVCINLLMFLLFTSISALTKSKLY